MCPPIQLALAQLGSPGAVSNASGADQAEASETGADAEAGAIDVLRGVQEQRVWAKFRSTLPSAELSSNDRYFYDCDEERISISGNIMLDTSKRR